MLEADFGQYPGRGTLMFLPTNTYNTATTTPKPILCRNGLLVCIFVFARAELNVCQVET